MIFDKDFADFLELLNKYAVDYMVVGGYALALHGKPRQTGDLDIWVNVSEDNAKHLLQAITDFGMGSLAISKEDFLKAGNILQIGYPPLRIDIISGIDGVTFDEAHRNRQTITLGELRVWYIGLEDFIRNKQASGRKQDLADLQELRKLEKLTPRQKPKRPKKGL